MIAALNTLVDVVEANLHDDIDVASVARQVGSTEYHLRRMFASLAGMSLSDYIRRRRMTLAAAELVAGGRMLDVAVAHGYGSTEAFARAFHQVHGVSPAHVRDHGGPLRSQSVIRFRLTVEGTTTMHTRIVDHPALRLVGHSTRVPLIHEGPNPHIQEFIASLPASEHERLKSLSAAEPGGLLQVSDSVDPDYVEGTELTYLHGVAVPADARVADDLDVIEVPAGAWAVFRASGAYPAALQSTWAATASEWFPSNPWRLRPGPSLVAVLDRADDFSTATTELWLPVEPA
ncbi:AraC family transcriptional regulator [Microbacteriaceae bacterium SG_E_30_P1]|uniref:AraC family transcriptional regulator n=1 Tax=Antiquaquibacter oligotrophicus TaxID=2880260 RepID=A0ABT6KQQ5_9MICO|nr:GyrI-like domain-containing protein [Antiquaquibacter oligotrophicus]MDH6182316.1 AraC family transcriptional regulator [Antiquaquibacter oligotrophicus]UDF12029.1 GyrI-like domain-containing protein [Antiquaquibacter oligotrophicus]